MQARLLLRAFPLVVVLAGVLGASACVTVRAPPPPLPPPPHQPVTFVTFYDSLAPHGEWIFIHGFGRVWRPWRHVVGIGFIPYSTGGHWEYTQYGWVFVSNWEWGRTVFHYGRWFYLDGEGWLWLPDTVWGPAWVEWRYGGGYVCWAPLPPPRVTVIVRTYRPFWYVVPTRYFPHGRHIRHLLPPHEATPVVTRATPVPPRGRPTGPNWHVGPPPGAVGTEAREEIRPRSIPRPEALPPQVLDVPKSAKVTELPPPGQRTGRKEVPEPPPGRVVPQPVPPQVGPGQERVEPKDKPTPPARVQPEQRPAPPVHVQPEQRPAPPARVQPEQRPATPILIQPEPRPTPPARTAPASERRRAEPVAPPPGAVDEPKRPVPRADPPRRTHDASDAAEPPAAPKARPAPPTRPEGKRTPPARSTKPLEGDPRPRR
jgi:hypothetical protein